MAAMKGRSILLRWRGAVVAGVREKSLALNGEAIDVTSDEDGGWRTLLANVSAEDQVDLSVSGIFKSEILVHDWFAGMRTQTASFELPSGAIISGTFNLTSMSITGPYNEGATFEATFQSSGIVTYQNYS